MAKYAIIENDVVINVIEADDKFIKDQKINGVKETEETGVAYIGGKFVDGVFNPRELTAEEIAGMEKIRKRAEALTNEPTDG
jgi:hypothetical protein